jgi:Fic family protein
MDLLFGVSTHGAWDLWVEFCLQGVVAQAIDTQKRCDKLLALYRDFHKRLKGGSVRLSGLVDGLFENPVTMVTTVKDRFGVSYPTARSDLRKLQTLGIVSELERAGQITFYCAQIYAVTYEDI